MYTYLKQKWGKDIENLYGSLQTKAKPMYH